jgi:hypothetical protein
MGSYQAINDLLISIARLSSIATAISKNMLPLTAGVTIH